EVLTIIYPMENPDGRDRYLAQMQQWNGDILNSDVQSIQHTGVWPWGRTNHYLFDLNRDWFILAHPESRSRAKTILEWNPQMVVDAHEMGPYDTYLFPPARDPINPNYHKNLLEWNERYAADQAKAFDRYGWSYYTREWLEDFYPGYGSSWGYLLGAVPILYEQASTDGSLIKRPDGTFLTFRESVHHQFTSSIANITTTADNRAELLQEFYQFKTEALGYGNKIGVQAYYITPGKNPSRAGRLIERLLAMNVEVEVAEADFTVKSARSYWGAAPVDKTLPKGTFIIRLNQPLSPLVNAVLEFDTRMSSKFLASERESLEKGEGTRVYDVIAWSM
ncbi:MAG: peptidase, partial [candidate division Zixibacteria bacterium]|nr:peptidase [candidate division Zixibacteria bacterium]